MTMINHQKRARQVVFEYVLEQVAGTDKHLMFTSINQVVVTWWSKTLGNWKALVVTDLDDDMYYEVTHDGEKKVTYLDAYVKIENRVIPDKDAVAEMKSFPSEIPQKTLEEIKGKVREAVAKKMAGQVKDYSKDGVDALITPSEIAETLSRKEAVDRELTEGRGENGTDAGAESAPGGIPEA